MLTREDLIHILVDMEADNIEKTVSVKDANKFGEAICSFSNDMSAKGQPGYLIVGANDDGTVPGIDINEQIIQTLLDFRTDGRIVPPPTMTVDKYQLDDGDVAVVTVQPSPVPPVRYKGKVCIRIGPRKGVANEAEERILSEKRSTFARTFDTQPCFGSTLEDLSINIFKIGYLPTAIDQETLQQNGREIKEQLASLKFYDLAADCPTNAGIIMFGLNPRFFLPGAKVQYVKFDGLDEVSQFSFEHSFDGDLTTQLKVMGDFIKSQVIKKVQHNLEEEYKYSYPEYAIKELLYNAVIHRDYQSNAPIKFYEYDDRIEIINPGGLYGDARPENFPNQNDYRNPTIAEAAKNLGFVNSFNVGIKRAKAALQANNNTEPKFEIDQVTSFGVIIYK